MIACVILNYNGRELLRQCLRSLPACLGIVVDNASADGSQEMVEEEFSAAKLIRRPDNAGTAGMNEGIQYALTEGADYVFLANNDVVFRDAGVFDRLVSSFKGNVGIVAPRQRLPNDQLIKGGGRVARLRLSTWEPQGEELDYAWNCMVRRDVFVRIGLIEPSYFMYWEDVDFGARARGAGYRIMDCPEAVIDHVGSATNDRIKGLKGYLRLRNKLLYSRRNHSLPHQVYDTVVTTLELPFQLQSRLRQRDAILTLRGYLDGIGLMLGLETNPWKP